MITKEIYRYKLDGIGMQDLDDILLMAYGYANEQFKNDKKGYVLITKDKNDIIIESFKGRLIDIDKVKNLTNNEFLYSIKFDRDPFTNDEDGSEWLEELSILRLQLEPQIKVLNWDGEEYE